MSQRSQLHRAILRTLAMTTVATIVCFSLMGARKGKPQSGIIIDGTFVDSTSGFSVPISKDWKAKLRPAESGTRLELVHQNPPIENPRNWRSRTNAKNLFSSSKVRISYFASKCSSKDVVDSMISNASSWKLREELWSDMTPNFSGSWKVNRVAELSRRPVTIASRKATLWRGDIWFANSGIDYGWEMGLFMIAVDCDGHVLLVSSSCGESVMDWLSGETVKVLDSLKFISK